MKPNAYRANGTPRKREQSAEVLIIGLGNPILGDDGVGWKVARAIEERLGEREKVEVDCLAIGGLGLMERMLGYGRVILVDAIETGNLQPGAVTYFELHELQALGRGHTGSAHDATLGTALQAATAMGAATPKRVDVVAIESRACYDFSEELSPELNAAVPVATQMVLNLLDD